MVQRHSAGDAARRADYRRERYRDDVVAALLIMMTETVGSPIA